MFGAGFPVRGEETKMSYNLARLKYTHEAMIDLMVVNPCVSVGELAARFGLTEPWIYRIRSSNAFRELLRKRTSELVDPLMVAEIEERFDSMVNRSLEVLMDKLAKPSEEVDPGLALQAATLGAKARGYGGFGAKVAPAAAPPDPNRIENLATRLRSLNQGGVVDVEATEIPAARV